jgi:RNA polymerase sigma-70 factor, ECF subfamily
MLSDEALYEALIGGDLRAFDTLYERYERHLFAFIRHHVPDQQEAEDVFHESFLIIIRNRAGARSARSLRAWLFQIARHLCLNRDRTRRREAQALDKAARGPADAARHPDHELEQIEAQQALSNAIKKMPVQLGEVYRLRSQGLSYEEIAEVLAVPLGTVKSRMHQMVAQLRKEMANGM